MKIFQEEYRELLKESIKENYYLSLENKSWNLNCSIQILLENENKITILLKK